MERISCSCFEAGQYSNTSANREPIVIYGSYAFPLDCIIDYLFGKLLRAKVDCDHVASTPSPSNPNATAQEIRKHCISRQKTVAFSMISLFSVLLVLLVIFYILSQKLSRRKSKYFRLFSLISFLLLSLTFLPFAINDFFKTWEEFCFHLDACDLENSPYLNEEDVDELTFCCCCVCYNKKSHLSGLSELLCHKFPNHKTANQFFTPLMFSAYHREGFRACVEAEAAEFLKDNHDVLEV